jgi:hypothetical protein
MQTTPSPTVLTLETPTGMLRRVLRNRIRSVGCDQGISIVIENLLQVFLSAATLVAADYGFTCPPRFMSVCCLFVGLGRTETAISQPCAVRLS